MVKQALPDSRTFRMPHLSPDLSTGITCYDRFRLKRRSLKGLWQGYRTLSEAEVWKKIAAASNEGDIVSGHLRYGAPQLPDVKLDCITLLRNPIDRMVSEYNYHREGYQARSRLHKVYMAGLLEIAGTRSFSEYIAYLHDHKWAFGNKATSYVMGNNPDGDPFEFMCRNYFHFGILDEMEFFAEELSQKLNRAVKSTWINRTRNPVRHSLSSTDEAILEELLDKDLQLYRKTVDFVRAEKAARGRPV